MALQGSMLDWGPYGGATPEQMQQLRIATLRQQASQGGRRGEEASKQLAEEMSAQKEDAALALREREFQETKAEHRQTHQDVMAQRQVAQASLDEARQARTQQGAEALATRTNAELMNIAQSPYLNQLGLDPKQVPALRQYLMNEVYRRAQGGGGTVGAGAGSDVSPVPRNLMDVVGGAKPSPQDAAMQRTIAAAKGGAPAPLVGPEKGAGVLTAPTGLNKALAPPEDITGRVYGTTQGVTPETKPAWAIGELYGRQPSVIPTTGPAGFYGSKGEFLGPQYGARGEQLPMPHGAIGIRGATGATGDVADVTGGPGRRAAAAQEPTRLTGAGSSWGAPAAPPTNVAAAPQAVPTPTNWGSGAMSSGTRSGEWLGEQFKSLPIQVSMSHGGPAEDYSMRNVTPPAGVLPPLDQNQQAALEAARRAKAAADAAAAGQSQPIGDTGGY